jgi:hypothetical protein
MKRRLQFNLFLMGAIALLAATAFGGSIVSVGPTRAYTTPSAGFAAAQNGDIVEIDAGLYSGDVATITKNNLIIRGVGGRAHVDANGNNAGGKGIWVIQGTNTTVQNVEFSGATVVDQNGAGIRQEGDGLVVSNCYFHDNEDGILTGASATSDILIEYSEFAYNGYGDGYSHNMYIGNIRKFTLRYCYSHHSKIGHIVKTRARENYILYNRLMDESDGTSSYTVDMPDGGLTYLIGNLIQQGPLTDNSGIIAYAEEGGSNPIQHFYVVNNTIVNDRSAGTFISISGSAPATSALIVNNVFVGNGTQLSGTGVRTNNLVLDGTQLVNRANFDYHLVPGSSAIDAGIDPGTGDGFSLTPVYQYVHPASRQTRSVAGALDVGAYEYTGSTNSLSVFAIQSMSRGTGTTVLIQWPSQSNKTYSVRMSTNLVSGGWGIAASNLAANPMLNTYTSSYAQAATCFFDVLLENR